MRAIRGHLFIRDRHHAPAPDLGPHHRDPGPLKGLLQPANYARQAKAPLLKRLRYCHKATKRSLKRSLKSGLERGRHGNPWKRGNMAKNEQKIGWIGMGRMGFPMAERLLKAGYDLSIWNRTRANAEPLAAKGGQGVDRLTDPP